MLMSVRYESNLCAHNTDYFSSLVSLFFLHIHSPSLCDFFAVVVVALKFVFMNFRSYREATNTVYFAWYGQVAMQSNAVVLAKTVVNSSWHGFDGKYCRSTSNKKITCTSIKPFWLKKKEAWACFYSTKLKEKKKKNSDPMNLDG